MSDLDELARAVQNRRPVPYARPIIIREPQHGGFYYLAGLALFLWTALCISAGAFVVKDALEDRPATLGELGVGGIASNWNAGQQAPAVMEQVKGQRLTWAVVACGGIALGWAVLATPMALVMIASKR